MPLPQTPQTFVPEMPSALAAGGFVPESEQLEPQSTVADANEAAMAATLYQAGMPSALATLQHITDTNFDTAGAVLSTGNDMRALTQQAYDRGRASIVANALDRASKAPHPLRTAMAEGEKLLKMAEDQRMGGDYMASMAAVDEEPTVAGRQAYIDNWAFNRMKMMRDAQSIGGAWWDNIKQFIPLMSIEIILQGSGDVTGENLEAEKRAIRTMDPSPEKLRRVGTLLNRLYTTFEGDMNQVETAMDSLFNPENMNLALKTYGMEAAFLVPLGTLVKASKLAALAGKVAGTGDTIADVLVKGGVKKLTTKDVTKVPFKGMIATVTKTTKQTLTSQAVEQASGIKTIARGSRKVAGAASASAAVSTKAASVFGTTTSQAGYNAIPHPNPIPSHVAGIAPEQIAAHSDTMAQFRGERINPLFTEPVLEMPPLNGAESAKVEAGFISDYSSALGTRGTVRSLVPTQRGSQGFTVRATLSAKPRQSWTAFKKQFPTGEAPVVESPYGFPKASKLTFDDKAQELVVDYDVSYVRAGLDSTPDLSKVKLGVVSYFMKQAVDKFVTFAPNMVKGANVALHQQNARLQQAQKIVHNIERGLGKEQSAKYHDIVRRADEQHRDFNLEELLGETHGDWDIVNAVTKHRDTMDAIHFLENDYEVRQRLFDGWRGVSVAGTTKTAIGQSVESLYKDLAEHETLTMAKLEGKRVKTVTVTKKDLTEMLAKDEDLKLMKVKSGEEFPVKGKDGKETPTNLVIASGSRDLRHMPLNQKKYLPGYSPKIYKDAIFMVSIKTGAKLNGRESSASEVRALFDSERDAQQYVAEETVAQGVKSDRFILDDLRKRSIDPLAEDRLASISGLFHDPRSTAPITYGLKRESPRTFNPSEAMERNLAYVSRVGAYTNFRMENIQRFLNLTREAEKQKIARLEDPNNWRSTLVISSTGNKTAVALQDMQNYLRDILGIRSPEMNWWDGFIQNTTDWMEGKQWANVPLRGKENLKARRIVDNMRAGGIISAAKTAAYHGLLGFWNASQLFVQAMGFAAAFALDPLRAPKFFYQSGALGWTRSVIGLAHLATTAEKEAFIKRQGKRFGFNENEFHGLYKMYERSGLWDAVRANADYSYVDHGFSMTGGLLRRVANSGLMFVRGGERFASTYSFARAAHEWSKATGKTFAQITKQDAVDILTRTTDLTGLMSAANKAWFQNQKGLALPTQFFSITHHMISNALPEALGGTARFTGGEKARIFTGQMLMFGAAGIPFASYWSVPLAKYVSEFSDTPGGEIDPGVATNIQNGAAGFLTQLVFGDPLNLSKRGSVYSGVEDMARSLTDGNIQDAMLGAAGTVPKRLLEATGLPWPFHAQGRMMPRIKALFNGDFYSQAPETMAQLADDLLRVTSTWSAQHRAEFASKLGAIFDANGNRIVSDPSRAAIVAMRLGFQPSILDAYRSQVSANQQASKNRKELVNTIAQMRLEYRTGEWTPERQQYYDNIQLGLMAPYANSPKAVHDILSAVSQKEHGDDRFTSANRRFMQNMEAEVLDHPALSAFTISDDPNNPDVGDESYKTLSP